jgi:exonuclease SbcD
MWEREDMRFVHTSDWHLGRSFGSLSLRRDQEAFCDWLVELVRSEAIELVVVAGDLYDRAIAPNESIELFRDTMRRLRSQGTVVAAITGNHDGADRVAAYHDLLDLGGLYLRGGYTGAGDVITHEFTDGPLDLVMVPFLDPLAAPDEVIATADNGPADTTETVEERLDRRRRATHQSVLEAAFDRARAQRRAPRSLAIAHAFVIGATTSDSERQLEVGGTGAVDASIFEGFDYTALGHLHRPQSIGARIRYSGTPLAYSFSEDHDKSVVVGTMNPTGSVSLDTVAIPVGRRVTTVTGNLEDLVTPGAHPHAPDRFVRAIITDRGTVLDAKARLEAVYPWVVEVRLQPVGRPETIPVASQPTADVSPLDATVGFWTDLEGSAPDGLIAEILTAAVASSTKEDRG